MKRYLTTTALALSLVSGTAEAAPFVFLTDANKDEAFVEVADLGQFLTRLLGEGGSAQWSYNDDDDDFDVVNVLVPHDAVQEIH